MGGHIWSLDLVIGQAVVMPSDPRFARLKTDPRFKKPQRNASKIEIDPRFKSVFDEKPSKRSGS